MTDSELKTHISNLIELYTPYLYFHRDETCFPITIEKYLNECNLCMNKSFKDSPDLDKYAIIDFEPTSSKLFEIGANPLYFLKFKQSDSLETLKGDKSQTFCYVGVHIDDESSGNYTFIYNYIYSHTEAYKCMNCLPYEFESYAHLGDVKFNILYIRNNKIDSMFFGAHGTYGGQYVKKSNISFVDSHPVVYVCRGDHSNYYDSGWHPRIFCAVCDVTSPDYLSKPTAIRIYDKNDSEFDLNTMGWLYFLGKMSPDGINAPMNQFYMETNYYNTISNNSFKRLCIPKYF
jgi:hypothetical protein